MELRGPEPPGAPPPRVPFRRRTRVVAWAKVLLPLTALALLSTVFLLARSPQGGSAIPFARLEEIAREPRMDAPRLAGVAPDGTAVTLEARRLTPLAGRASAFVVDAPRVETLSPDGLAATLTAAAGEADGATGTLRLTGGVTLAARVAGGAYAASAPEVSADLALGTLAAMGGVAAAAPFGRLEAESLAVDRGPEGGAGARLVFTGGVRLLYQPPGAPASEAAPEARPGAPEGQPGRPEP